MGMADLSALLVEHEVMIGEAEDVLREQEGDVGVQMRVRLPVFRVHSLQLNLAENGIVSLLM